MFVIRKYGTRNWAIYRPDGSLLAVVLYRKGATAVAKELNSRPARKEPDNNPAFLLKREGQS